MLYTYNIIGSVSDTLPLSSCWPDKKDDKKKRSDESTKKEAAGEIDVEVMEFISLSAGEPSWLGRFFFF